MNKANPIGKKIWLQAIFFGIIGQIAWVVENMYFATFAQDVFANSGRSDLSYVVTTLMVIFSAITATITTIIAGALSDKFGTRKPFISIGYIVWGITIMLFSTIPMKVEAGTLALIGFLLVLFDCIMTVAGSTSNDAAFNAWVTDNTDETNRGKLNGILSILPVFAVVVVFIGLGNLYNKDNASNALFFIILGLIPLFAGLIGIFTLKDSKNIIKNENLNAKDVLYGFKKDVIKNNKLLYVTLIGSCLIGISQQTFFSYLINFLIKTLDLGDSFVIPMAIIIVGSAFVTGVFGFMFDKFGRKKFYVPLLVITVLGILSFFLIQYTNNILKTLILYFGGILMMGGILSLTSAFTSNFQDYIPLGYEGRFQGVRMCFMVLIPMIIGPIISLILGLDAMGLNGDDFIPPFTMFLAASLVAVLAIVPIIIIRKNTNK